MNKKNQGYSRTRTRYLNYVLHRSYTKTDHYFIDLAVAEMDYSFGPYYQTFLESSGIPVDIRLSLRKIEGGNPSRFLKRQISERKAELRLSGTNVIGNEKLRKQISDLEKILNKYESENIQPVNVSIIFRVFASHPAILNENVQRIKMDLGIIGFNVKQLPSNRNSVMGFFHPKVSHKLNYLMNTLQASSILPVFREPYADESGVVIGVDDESERFVHFDPFAQNSYNILIVGETGSGKSFFGKLLITRNIQSGTADRAIIFDPLNEYFCNFFGQDCSEIEIGEFVVNHSWTTDKTYDSSFEESVNHYRRVLIVKGTPVDLENEDLVHNFLKALNTIMMGNKEQKSLFAFDECHIILKSLKNSRTLGQMVRHSRHFNTGIINISQNTDDFLNDRTNTIPFNSNRIFIFRTRNLRETHKKILKLDDFDTMPPERLMGGKLHPYSECLMTDGEFCRKLRVISTELEDATLQLF